MFPSFKGQGQHVFSVVSNGGPFTVTFPEGDNWGEAFGVTRTHPDANAAFAELFRVCKERKIKLTPVARPVHEIAREIRRNWSKVYFGAVPYLQAMGQMEGVGNYGADSGASILRYFMGNAASYRGPLAKAHKEELKALAP